MTGYEIYCYCRALIRRNRPSEESYNQSHVSSYYNMLSEYLTNKLKLSDKDSKDFIRCNYAKDEDNFNPFSLINEDCLDIYNRWKVRNNNKFLYFEDVLNGIRFIENFCIGRNISFDEYVQKFSAKHIRENKFDWAIAVYCNMVDVKGLKKVEKILLKKFLSQYNIIKQRLNNGELVKLMNERILQMKHLLSQYQVTK